MRDLLAANISFVSLFADQRSLLRGYTHISAPVSTRKEIFDFLSVTKMRRDIRLSSHAVFADGWFRFPWVQLHGERHFFTRSLNIAW